MSGSQLILVTISLSADMKGEDFDTFMEQTVLPDIHMGPTRVGMVEGGDLYRSVESERDYIWAIRWNGLAVPNTILRALEKLQSRGIQTSMTRYNRVSSFPSPGDS